MLCAMVAVLLLAFALSVGGLMSHPIWIDELYSLAHMGVFEPPYDFAQVYDSLSAKSPNQLPLYYWLGALWAQAVGWTQAAMRALSLLLGMLTLALLYRFGADALDRRTGFFAALLLGTSVFALIYFAFLRNYALLLLLAALNGWLYWRLLNAQHTSPAALALFSLSSALLLYTHYLSLVWIASLLLHALICARQGGYWRRIVLGVAGGFLLFLPILPSFVQGIRYSTERQHQWNDSSSSLELLPAFIELLSNGAPVLLLLAGMLFVAAQRKLPDSGSGKLLLLLAIQLALMVLADSLINLVWLRRMRYFLMLWLPACIVIAYCISAWSHWKAIFSVGILLWLAAGLRFQQSARVFDFAEGYFLPAESPPLQKLSPLFANAMRPQDFLLAASDTDTLNNIRRMGKSIADYYLEALLNIDGFIFPSHLTGTDLRERFEDRVGNHPYLLFMRYEGAPAGLTRELTALAHSRYRRCEPDIPHQDFILQRYALAWMPCERGAYQPFAFENGIHIVDRYAVYQPAEAMLRAVIGWEVATSEHLKQYNVTAQVFDRGGNKVLQAPDRHLYDKVLKWQLIELPTEALLPGDYRLALILYERARSSKRVAGADLTSGDITDMPTLLRFTVE